MQALVRLLIEQIDLDRRQGLRTRGYVSGYRGSPVGAFDSAIWQAGAAITDRGIHFNPGINEELAMTANNKKQAADILSITRKTLYNKLQKYGLE